MIIFGTRSKILSNDNDKTFTCNYCNVANSVYIYKQITYFHVFWIPMFPFSNTLITQCAHCKQVAYENELHEQNRELLRSNFNKKTPLQYYAGLLIIGGLVLFIAISQLFS